jgi:subtilase family serine protease
MPAFQYSVVGASFLKLDSTHRSIPDIAYDADPTYSPVGVVAKGIWYGVGGTSVGAPQWSGIAALIAQYRVENSRSSTLTGLVASNSAGFNGIIYGSGWHTSSSLFDVTSGNDNTGRTKTCSICTAATGYDAATGWGVPNVGNLVANF